MNKRNLILIYFFINFIMLSANDLSDDKVKKADKPAFLFYVQDKVVFENSVDINEFNYRDELNFSINYKKNFYEFNYYINNILLLDFIPVLYSFRNFMAVQMFNENFSTGVNNNFKIKKILKIFTNIEAGLYVPFSSPLSIYLSPGLEFSGDYYYGFFWNIEGYMPVEYFPDSESALLTLKSNLILGYEFFRFYGPKKFKFALEAENQSKVFFPLFQDISTYENRFKAGTYFTIVDRLQPYAYFILNNYGEFGTIYVYNLIAGFNAGINIILKYFLFTADYSGSYDFINKNWINRIEVIFKFSLYIK